MKYLVFIIYIIIVMQFIDSKPIAKNGMHRGHTFYKISGIVNLLFGFLGMFTVNTFLRDKDIIPPAFIWIALIGFFIIVIYGMYCIYKMLVTTEL